MAMHEFSHDLEKSAVVGDEKNPARLLLGLAGKEPHA